MESVDELISRLWTTLKERRWSKSRLAEESVRLALAVGDRNLSLHVNTLTGFGKTGWDPRLETIRKIERVLKDSEPQAAEEARQAQSSSARRNRETHDNTLDRAA